MTENNKQDGGYYAIKGFEYQINKTIDKLLNAQDENASINLEDIQDINSESFVMQVKYKETQKFTPSSIKEPVIQLMEEFKNSKSKQYILFAYFNDMNGYEKYQTNDKKITMVELDRILGNKKNEFTEEKKQEFLEKFFLDFSQKHEDLFNKIIVKLRELNFVKNEDEAISHHANITNFLRNLVINNKKQDSQKRTCTKKQIIDLLKNQKKIIFDSAYRDYKGEKAYFKYLKETFFSFRTPTVPNIERFIILEIQENNKVSDIKDIVCKIKDKYYKEQRTEINSGAPYIFLKNISPDKLKCLKTELFSELGDYIFKDGYDFEMASFSVKQLIQESTKENKICLKFLNNEKDFKEIIEKHPSNKLKEIYQFFISDNELVIEQDIKHIKIKIECLSDIKQIIL